MYYTFRKKKFKSVVIRAIRKFFKTRFYVLKRKLLSSVLAELSERTKATNSKNTDNTLSIQNEYK